MATMPLLERPFAPIGLKRAASGTLLLLACLAATGCRSPYYRDQLALFGGLTGAGVGAVLGEEGGNALAGAAIGSAVGTVSGATVGQALDEVDARNRALIEAKLGRSLAGTASHDDIIAMAQAGLGDDVIITHIQTHGMVAPPSANDLIRLKNSGVSDPVLHAMQTRTVPAEPVAVPVAAPPVVVERHVYEAPWPPYWRAHPHPHRPCGPRHGFRWGFSFSK
jgi:hypothetical protein